MSTIPCSRNVGNWGPYFEKTCQRSSSALITKAVHEVEKHGCKHTYAIDLGAGSMNDSLYILQNGFEKVTAVDASTDSLPYANKVKSQFGDRFDFQNVKFSHFPFEQESADLVHANFSLPFHGNVGFMELMKAVMESVRLGGVCSIILLGNEDEWFCKKPDLAFVTNEQANEICKGFEISLFKEHKLEGRVHKGEDSPQATTQKFWHYFQIVGHRVLPVL